MIVCTMYMRSPDDMICPKTSRYQVQTFVKTDGSGNFLHFMSRTERELRTEENMVMVMVDPIQTTPVQATYIGEERITRDMDQGVFLTRVLFLSQVTLPKA